MSAEKPTSPALMTVTSSPDSATPIYWYDGQLRSGVTVPLSLQEPGLLYGATVFTTLRVYENTLDHPWTAWQAHVQRTTNSLQAFRWSLPDWDQLRQGARHLAALYPVLRLTLFPDGRGLITGRSLPEHLTTMQTAGVTAWVMDSPAYSRPFPGHKTGNYLGEWSALQAAQRAGAQEAILVDRHGHWLETSTGNLWGWDQGWWTPPLTVGILPGVLRSRLIQGLQTQGKTPKEAPWSPKQVSRFSYLAYTNSVLEVIPIQRVLQGSASVNYNPDQAKTQQLTQAWKIVV